MGWCDDPKSRSYNKLIKYPFNLKSEKLFRSDNVYDIILVLNFNMSPIKKNKGSAIFIHIVKKQKKMRVCCDKKRYEKVIKMISIKTTDYNYLIAIPKY